MFTPSSAARARCVGNFSPGAYDPDRMPSLSARNTWSETSERRIIWEVTVRSVPVFRTIRPRDGRHPAGWDAFWLLYTQNASHPAKSRGRGTLGPDQAPAQEPPPEHDERDRTQADPHEQ